MAIRAPQNITNVALKLTNATTQGTAYKPQNRQITVDVSGTPTAYTLPYHGQLAILRINAIINSLALTILPIDNLADTTINREAKAANLAKSPKVGVGFYLKKPDQSLYEMAFVEVYNVAPSYDTLVSTWFGDLTSFGVENGNEIFCQLFDYGHGLLQEGDYISLYGFALEDCEFLQDETGAVITV